MRKFFQIGLISVLFFSSTVAFAQSIDLPAIISDGMVVQSGKPVPVWGWSTPGETVKVWFKGKHRRARANPEGYWKVQFPSSEPGGPFKIKVAVAGTLKEINEVFVGDVWLVSGEGHGMLNGSIIESAAQSSDDSADGSYLQEAPAAANKANASVIRFFKVEQDFSAVPENDIGNEVWRLPLDPNVSASTISRMLAERNFRTRNVPVGVIEALWEDTPAQAWIAPQDQSHLSDFAAEAGSLLNEPHIWQSRFQKHRRNLEIRREVMNNADDFLSIGIHRDDYDEMAWPEINIPFDESWTGIVWLRKRFDWRGSPSQPAELFLSGLKDTSWAFINGKRLGELNADTTHVPIPAGTLRRGVNNLTLRIVNADRGLIQFGKHESATIKSANNSAVLEGTWKYNDVIEGRLPRILQSPQRTAGVLYNAMIHPLKGYPIAGVIWHQGESNLEQAGSYELLLRTLIYSWRLKWNEMKLPFIVIQVPAADATAEPLEGARAELRSAQHKALTLPYTNLAATLDLPSRSYGEKEFNEVIHRIWRLAETSIFGGKGPVATGPVLKKSHRKNKKIVLKFDAAADGLILGENGETELHQSGLELFTNDELIEPRQVAVDGDTITLDVGDIADAITVRYAWADNPSAGIYNSEKLPALPFEAHLK